VKLGLLAALLVLWGNLLQPILGARGVLPGGSWQFVAAGLALVALSLLAARWLGLDDEALGLRREGALRGALVGLLTGGLVAAISVAVLRSAPVIIGRPISYEPLLDVTGDQLARHIALFLPLGAVLPEEVAFRGTILGALVRRGGARFAAVGSAVAFALWHATVGLVTVGETTLGPPSPLFVPAFGAVLVVLFVGGAIMAVLRLVTGALSAPIAAHWAFNAVILVGLWTAETPAPPIG
jgi:membrane protease YdiL (CAAX protease family)